ncbi:amidase [bacterium]|nr:amidase [bacterium]
MSINSFSKKLRQGEINCEQIVTSYLNRIKALNDKLNAFIFIDEKKAINNAIAIDKLLKSGVDLGPLMGLPVAIKDICSVNDMPTTNGSIVNTDDITGEEGSLVKRLKELGCVVIGKTHTVEFALGATGLNKHRGTPWNPWDLETHRIPGGSSSGSAVAVASGLVPFAIGTDTGGSVRIPASLTGVAGLKTTKDVWPTDGIFPLSPTLDTPGPLARSFEDIKTIFETYGSGVKKDLGPIHLSNLKLAKLGKPFTDDLDEEVQNAYEKICKKLKEKGATLIELDIPEALERVNLFPPIVGSEIIHAFGEKRFLDNCDNMDPVTAKRAKVGLDVKSADYLKFKNRLKKLEIMASDFFKDYDALISPTTVMRAMKVEDCEINGKLHDRSLLSSANTQPGNLFNLCGISYPIQKYCNDYKSDTCLPVGLQVLCANGNDSKAIEIGISLEKEFGQPEFPNLDNF